MTVKNKLHRIKIIKIKLIKLHLISHIYKIINVSLLISSHNTQKSLMIMQG